MNTIDDLLSGPGIDVILDADGNVVYDATNTSISGAGGIEIGSIGGGTVITSDGSYITFDENGNLK